MAPPREHNNEPAWLTRRRAGWTFTGILSLYFAAGMFFNWLLPIGEGPDEYQHFCFVRFVVEHHALPVMQAEYDKNDTVQAIQPPLYYALGALVVGDSVSGDLRTGNNPRFTFGGDQPAYLPMPEHSDWLRAPVRGWRLLRIFSLLCGGAGLWLCYGLLRALREPRWMALAVVAGIGLNPKFIFTHSVITNDALTVAASASTLWCAVRLMRRPELTARWAWVGLVLAAAVMTKLNLLGLALPVGVAAALGMNKLRREGLPIVRACLLLLACAFFPGHVWFVRNLHTYGDLFASHIEQLAVPSVFYAHPLGVFGLLGKLPAIARELFREQWSCFGWLNINAPGWYVKLIFATYLLAGVGWLRMSRLGAWRARITAGHLIVMSAFAGLLLMLLLRNFTTFAAQYRYLWGAHVAVVWLLVQGWRGMGPGGMQRPWRLLPVIIAAHVLIIALAVGTTLWPLYGALRK